MIAADRVHADIDALSDVAGASGATISQLSAVPTTVAASPCEEVVAGEGPRDHEHDVGDP